MTQEVRETRLSAIENDNDYNNAENGDENFTTTDDDLVWKGKKLSRNEQKLFNYLIWKMTWHELQWVNGKACNNEINLNII